MAFPAAAKAAATAAAATFSTDAMFASDRLNQGVGERSSAEGRASRPGAWHMWLGAWRVLLLCCRLRVSASTFTVRYFEAT